jgi:hypothetical protein
MRILPWVVALSVSACGGNDSSNQDASRPFEDVGGRADMLSGGDTVSDTADAHETPDAPLGPEVGREPDTSPADLRVSADLRIMDIAAEAFSAPDGTAEARAPADLGMEQRPSDGGIDGQRDAAVRVDSGLVDVGPAGACAIPTPAFAALVPQRTVHVASDGSDTSGDGSAGLPFATIERAARGITAGTAIAVHAGTYDGGIWLESVRGTETAPIWIGGVAGEARPVIQGQSEGLHVANLAWVVLHDLEIRGASANGLNVDDGGDYADAQAAHHVVFQRLLIHDIGSTGNQDCLKLSGVNDYAVLDSEFATCGDGGSAIDHVGCHRGTIAHNLFRDVGSNAVQAKGGSENIEIRANHIINGGDRAFNLGGSTGFEYFRPPLSTTSPNFEARSISAFANLIEGSVAAVAFVGCVDCVAANNTIIDPTRWVVRVLQETTSSGEYEFLPASGGRFVNNLVWYSRAALSTHVNVGPDTDAPSFLFSHNLWYAHDDPGRSAPTLPVTEAGSVVGQDPLFASGGYALQPGSPAVGQGDLAGASGGDFTGICYQTPPSIGAYEKP